MTGVAEREGTLETSEKTVLIVDSSEETRNVLATVLERRGVRTISSATARRGAALARNRRPDLVVFDVETDDDSTRRAVDSFARAADLTGANVPILAIGTAKFEAPSDETNFIAKPYHFAPLLRKIETLLASSGEGREAEGTN